MRRRLRGASSLRMSWEQWTLQCEVVMGASVQQIGSGRSTSALSGALNREKIRSYRTLHTRVSFKALSWATFDKSTATYDWHCRLCALSLVSLDRYHYQ